MSEEKKRMVYVNDLDPMEVKKCTEEFVEQALKDPSFVKTLDLSDAIRVMFRIREIKEEIAKEELRKKREIILAKEREAKKPFENDPIVQENVEKIFDDPNVIDVLKYEDLTKVLIVSGGYFDERKASFEDDDIKYRFKKEYSSEEDQVRILAKLSMYAYVNPNSIKTIFDLVEELDHYPSWEDFPGDLNINDIIELDTDPEVGTDPRIKLIRKQVRDENGNRVEHHTLVGCEEFEDVIEEFRIFDPFRYQEGNNEYSRIYVKKYVYDMLEICPDINEETKKRAIQIKMNGKVIGRIKDHSISHVLNLIRNDRIAKTELVICKGEYVSIPSDTEELFYKIEDIKREYQEGRFHYLRYFDDGEIVETLQCFAGCQRSDVRLYITLK